MRNADGKLAAVERTTRTRHARDVSSTHAILAAIKPDDASNAALAMAHWLAEHERRELHVVSVITNGPPISSVAAGAPFIPRFHDEAERRRVERDLRVANERLRHPASRFTIDVLEGSPAPAVAEAAREHDARMVVVGRGTHGLLRHLLYGEQVMEIIRRSRSPVLVVPPDATAPIERAMVAFDFSMASIRAAATAYEMLGAGGRLALVHVVSPRGVTDKRSQWRLRSMERRARETLEEFARALPAGRGVAVETEKLHGDPVDVLTEYAASHSMQLLACGWHEHALLDRVFGESHTSEILHRARCAVLVTPEPRGWDHDDAS